MLCNLNPNLRSDRIQDPIHLKPNGDSIVLLQKIEVKSVTTIQADTSSVTTLKYCLVNTCATSTLNVTQAMFEILEYGNVLIFSQWV